MHPGEIRDHAFPVEVCLGGNKYPGNVSMCGSSLRTFVLASSIALSHICCGWRTYLLCGWSRVWMRRAEGGCALGWLQAGRASRLGTKGQAQWLLKVMLS